MDTITTDLQQQHLALARLQQQTHVMVAGLQAARDTLYAEYIKPLEDSIAAAQKSYDDALAQFKAEAISYFKNTGDKDLGLAGVTIKRLPREWDYDEDKIVPLALQFQPDLLKQTLKKREFKALLAEPPAWLQGYVQPLPTAYTCSVGKLGDVVILAETKVQESAAD